MIAAAASTLLKYIANRMYDAGPHPLLAQVPLTVSPFLSLPTTPTLPYTYKSLPTTLPPSSTDLPASQAQNSTQSTASSNAFIISPSGTHTASPDDIINSCAALQKHIEKLHDDAKRTLREWEESIRARELAEKRRVAPGWLDRSEKILEPVRVSGATLNEMGPTSQGLAASSSQKGAIDVAQPSGSVGREMTEGEELDRAFGAMSMR